MKKIIILFMFPLLFFSCADEQDFDQFDDLGIEPIVASSLFYFESDEGTINAGTANFYEETFTFWAFSEAFDPERIMDGVITYEVENTTSKPLNILIGFLDADGNVLDTEGFMIAEEPVPLLERQVAYGNGGKPLDILRNTTTIRVSGENLGDTTSGSPQNEPKIILRSSAVFRVRLR